MWTTNNQKWHKTLKYDSSSIYNYIDQKVAKISLKISQNCQKTAKRLPKNVLNRSKIIKNNKAIQPPNNPQKSKTILLSFIHFH